MEADARLIEALALLRGDVDPRGGIVATDLSVASGRVSLPGAEIVESRALAERLRESPTPTIIALHSPTPTLLRLLRKRPPALLVVTGEVDPELAQGLEELPGTALLGPEATLRCGSGELLICAAEEAGLSDLVHEIGEGSVAIALAPTPPWLVIWLEDHAPRTIGFIDAAALNTRWSGWIRGLPIERSSRHIIVPLGLPEPRVDVPRHPSLGPAVAAHALERTTGPVYPSAAVLAAIARGTEPSVERPSEAVLGRWRQARRALPLTGATPGMESPLPGLSTAHPGAAYLAQRSLIRQQRSLQLIRERAEEELHPLDDSGYDRSLEVLRSAGEVLSEHESKVVLHGFGMEVTRQAVASSASGAASFAETIGFPVVLKAVSPDLRRKRELGAVVLDLTTAASVRRAYAQIVANVEERAPDAHLDGVLVAEQIDEGLELQCGAVRLDSGEIALYGRPIGLQAPQEHVLVASPLSTEDALLLANAILTRVPVPALRRRSDPDVEVVASLFLRLDELVRESEDRLLSVDLTPIRLIGGERGYVTLDARIVQRSHLEGL